MKNAKNSNAATFNNLGKANIVVSNKLTIP
jgi:hypothetical protein